MTSYLETLITVSKVFPDLIKSLLRETTWGVHSIWENKCNLGKYKPCLRKASLRCG